MRGTLPATMVALALFAALPVAATARPSVVLNLTGSVVTKDAKGQEKDIPLAGAAIVPGQTILYVITAVNKGDSDARNLVPSGKIPTGTSYEAGSASTANAERVEFSLDGGKAWSTHPTVTVHTPAGDVTKPADPATYTNVRWIADKPLQPKAVSTYSYKVKIK